MKLGREMKLRDQTNNVMFKSMSFLGKQQQTDPSNTLKVNAKFFKLEGHQGGEHVKKLSATHLTALGRCGELRRSNTLTMTSSLSCTVFASKLPIQPM